MVSGVMVVRADLSRWDRGFSELERHKLAHAAVEEWDLAVEALFGATQQYAHVLSGDMLETGRYNTEVDGQQVVGTIEYGGIRASSGELVDYVEYELRRKGSHDFYTRAMRKTHGRLESGLSDAVKAAFDAAFGRL